MESGLEQAAADPAEVGGEQAEDVGAEDVERDAEPFAVAGEVEGLESVTGKRGVAAAEADHEEIAPFGFEPGAAAGGSADGGDEADGEAAGDVDDKRAQREHGDQRIMFRLMGGDEAVEPVAGQRAERSTNDEQQQSEHCVLCDMVGVISALLSRGSCRRTPSPKTSVAQAARELHEKNLCWTAACPRDRVLYFFTHAGKQAS